MILEGGAAFCAPTIRSASPTVSPNHFSVRDSIGRDFARDRAGDHLRSNGSHRRDYFATRVWNFDWDGME